MPKLRPVITVLSAACALAFSYNSFACGDEEKPKEDTKKPSMLCGDEEKPKEDTKKPSMLCGDEEKPKEDTKKPSLVL